MNIGDKVKIIEKSNPRYGEVGIYVSNERTIIATMCKVEFLDNSGGGLFLKCDIEKI